MMLSKESEKCPKCCIGDAALLCKQCANADKAQRRQRDHAPRQRPHGVDICRQSTAGSAIARGTWRGGIDTLPIHAIRRPIGSGNQAEGERSVLSAQTIRPPPLPPLFPLAVAQTLRTQCENKSAPAPILPFQ